MAEKLDPDFVTPLVVFLSSEACDTTHEIFKCEDICAESVFWLEAGHLELNGNIELDMANDVVFIRPSCNSNVLHTVAVCNG